MHIGKEKNQNFFNSQIGDVKGIDTAFKLGAQLGKINSKYVRIDEKVLASIIKGDEPKAELFTKVGGFRAGLEKNSPFFGIRVEQHV